MEGSFDNPDKIFPWDVRKNTRKHINCKSQFSPEYFSAHVECSFDKPSKNFLLEVRISWNTSTFPKKN